MRSPLVVRDNGLAMFTADGTLHPMNVQSRIASVQFALVHNASTTQPGEHGPLVNCPIVFVAR